MARVVSVGAIATVSRLPGGGWPAEDEDLVNLNVRVFAKLDQGFLVIDPWPQTMAYGLQRDRLPSAGEGLQEALRMQLPSEHREGHWGRVVDELAKINVKTDPETLMSLPFDFLPDSEARDLIEGAAGEPTR